LGNYEINVQCYCAKNINRELEMKKIIFIMIAFLFVTTNVSAVEIGEMAPDFIGKDMDGNDAFVSQYKGKVVVLTFWDIKNEESLQIIPVLSSIESYVDKNMGEDKLKIIGIAKYKTFSSYRREAKKMQKRAGLNYNFEDYVPISPNYFKREAGFPCTVLIDKWGRVAFMHLGFSDEIVDQLSREIPALLNQEYTE
jgi:hypothetical protein